MQIINIKICKYNVCVYTYILLWYYLFAILNGNFHTFSLNWLLARIILYSFLFIKHLLQRNRKTKKDDSVLSTCVTATLGKMLFDSRRNNWKDWILFKFNITHYSFQYFSITSIIFLDGTRSTRANDNNYWVETSAGNRAREILCSFVYCSYTVYYCTDNA